MESSTIPDTLPFDKKMGFSYQRARFVSGHIGDVTEERKQWMDVTYPKLLKLAKEKNAMILFGDEASFAQWGTLSYTWAPKGQNSQDQW